MKYLNFVIKWFLIIVLGFITAITFYQVIMRYVFNHSTSWVEELVVFLLAWLSMVGAAVGIREKVHIGIEAFVNLLPAKARRVTEVIVNLLIAAFGVFVFVVSLKLVTTSYNQISAGTGIRMSFYYSSSTAFGFLTTIYSFERIYNLLKGVTGQKEGE